MEKKKQKERQRSLNRTLKEKLQRHPKTARGEGKFKKKRRLYWDFGREKTKIAWIMNLEHDNPEQIWGLVFGERLQRGGATRR